ncbi:MAG: D-alanyl-D-alanine carboxypeptidase family protein, partial [Gemmobacter sp.]
MALLLLAPVLAKAAPFAGIVMDARTGKVLWEHNADTRLHPASLTKMLTLYIAFDAVKRGEVSLDDMVTVSAKAASEPPSRLGLRKGQRISLRHLIRAAAIKSANDAATAIGEHLSGSEAAFAQRMNRTAKALGMTRSTFRNAHGLTAEGHLSTARDMTLLGRRLFYDFPEYYGLFSRLTEDAGVAKVANTNRRFLESYRGADGIKTGYTNPAGFNLTASAERGNKRLVATVFGGTSTAQRNARMTEILDIGFGNAPASVRLAPPPPVALDEVAQAPQAATPGGAGKTIRLVTARETSPRPMRRPDLAAPPPEAVAQVTSGVADVLAALQAPEAAPVAPAPAAPAAVAAVAPPPPRPE